MFSKYSTKWATILAGLLLASSVLAQDSSLEEKGKKKCKTICPTGAYVDEDLPDFTSYTFTTTRDGTVRGSSVIDFSLIGFGTSAYVLSGTSDGCGNISFTATEAIDTKGVLCDTLIWTLSAEPDCTGCGTLRGTFVNTCTGRTSSGHVLTSSGEGFEAASPTEEGMRNRLQDVLLDMGD